MTSIGGAGSIDLVARARELAQIPDPTTNQVAEARQLLARPAIADVFFADVSSSTWFSVLWQTGSLLPAEPIRAGEGIRAPRWPAAPFVARACRSSPMLAVEFLVGLDTTNWVAIREALDMLPMLPGRLISRVTPRVGKWLEIPQMGGFLLDEALALGGKLRDAGTSRTTATRVFLAVLEHLLARSGSDTWLLSRAIVGARAFMPVADARTSGAGFRRLLVRQLEAEFGTPNDDRLVLRRPSVGDDPDDWQLTPSSTMVSIMRDWLAQRRGSADYPRQVGPLMRSPWKTAKRIAIFEAAQNGAALDVIASAVDWNAFVADYHFSVEFRQLALSDSPPPGLVRAAIELIRDARGQAQYGEHARLLSAARRALRTLPSHLVPEDVLAIRTEEYGADFEPDSLTDADFAAIGPFRSGWATAPISVADLREAARSGGAELVLDVVQHPERHGYETSVFHPADQSWDVFAEYCIAENSIEALLAAPIAAFADYSGIYRLVDAAVTLAGRDPDSWRDVIDWMGVLYREADAGWAVSGALRDVSSVPPETRAAFKNLLEAILFESPDLTRAFDGGTDDSWILHAYLNMAAGRAAHAVVRLELEQGAVATLVNRVRNDQTHPLALGVAVGWYAPWLLDRERALASALLMQLSAPKAPSREAFWAGFLYQNQISTDALRAIGERFRPAVGDRGLHQMLGKDLHRRLLVQVAVADARGLREFAALVNFDVLGVPDPSAAISAYEEVLRAVASSTADDAIRARASALRFWDQALEHSSDGEPWRGDFLRWLPLLDEVSDGMTRRVRASIWATVEMYRLGRALEYARLAAATSERRAGFRIVHDVFDRLEGSDSLYWQASDLIAAVEATAPTDPDGHAYRTDWLTLVDRLLLRSLVDDQRASQLASLAR